MEREKVTSRMARCTNHEEPLESKLRDFDLLQHKCAQCGEWFNVKTGRYGDSGGKHAETYSCSLRDFAVRAGH